MGPETDKPEPLNYATPTAPVKSRPKIPSQVLKRFWISFTLAFLIMIAWISYILTCNEKIVITPGGSFTVLNPVSQYILWASYPIVVGLLFYLSKVLFQYKRPLRAMSVWLPFVGVLLLYLMASLQSVLEFITPVEYFSLKSSDGNSYHAYCEYWLDGGQVGLTLDAPKSLFTNTRTFIAVAEVGKEQFIKKKIPSHTQSADDGEIHQDDSGTIHVSYNRRCVIHYDPKTGMSDCQQ